MKITRHEEFEMAHILPNYKGGCGNLHGHTYKIDVTIKGEQNKKEWGMVLDFKVLKDVIKSIIPDHKFVYNCKNISDIELEIVDILKDNNLECIGYPFDTTAENLVGFFADKIQDKLPNNIKVVKIDLWETSKNHATWEAEDENC